MILITGTQRSGTSCLAGFLFKIGYDLGTRFWDYKADGGFESPSICRHYQFILNDSTFPFTNFNDLTKNDIIFPINYPFDVQKFSYLLMQPKFVDIWFRARGNKDKLIILSRQAEQVIKSKNINNKRRRQFLKDHYLLHLSEEQLTTNFNLSLQKIKKYRIEHSIFNFPKFLSDFDSVWLTITKYSKPKTTKEKARKIWNEYIDINKIHIGV